MSGGDKSKLDNRVEGLGNEIRNRSNGMNGVGRELKS